MPEIAETKSRLDTHEAVCALRYEGICARLKRIENVGITIAGAIIMLLLGIILKVG
jgi:hypothetical protein